MLKRLSWFDKWPEHPLFVKGCERIAKSRIFRPIIETGVRMYFRNPFQVQVVNSQGQVVQAAHGYNAIVNQGMNKLLDVFFRNQTQIPTWYMGLIDGTGTQTLSNSDVAGTHAGWTENTSYTGGPTRKNWTAALSAASSRSITNSTTLDFAFTTTQTIHGIFIINHATADTASEFLWATAPFSTEVTVNNGDTLKVTYTVSG